MRANINRKFLGRPCSRRVLAELRRRLNPSCCIVALAAVPPEYGYVYGGGTYSVGDQPEIGAVPYKGYELSCWSDGSIEAIRRIFVRSDLDISAYFRRDATGDIEFNPIY